MIYLKGLLKNTSKNTLHIYDFDDTLVFTKSIVHIKNTKTKKRKQIPVSKFYEYELKPNEEFDLSELENLSNMQTLPLFQEFIEDIRTLGPDNVVILTARFDPSPVYKFLKKFGISSVQVIPVGLKNPTLSDRHVAATRKKKWIRKQIIARNLGFLVYFDDNEGNIAAAKELEKEFPNITFLIELV